MSQLFAIVYDGPDAARRTADRLRDASRGGTIELADLVVAVRKPEGDVVLDQSVNLVAGGALGGAFWGSLVGLLFLNPIIGSAAGAAAGALGGWLSDYGIDDDFMKQLAMRVVPGKAALFVLARDMTVDKIVPLLAEEHGELLHSSLAADVDTLLAAALAGSAARGEATTGPTPTP